MRRCPMSALNPIVFFTPPLNTAVSGSALRLRSTDAQASRALESVVSV